MRTSVNTRRTVAVAIAGVIGAVLAFGGAALVVAAVTQRDASGYMTSSGEDYATGTYAFTTRSLDAPIVGSGGLARSVIGKVRITSDSARPVFVGIARADDVSAYLGKVQRAVLGGSYKPGDATVRGSGAPASPPAAQKFWAASALGAGKRTVDWKLRDGHWVAVLMNADASRGVAAHMRVGFEFPGVGWIGAGSLVAGLLLLAVGGLYLKRPKGA